MGAARWVTASPRPSVWDSWRHAWHSTKGIAYGAAPQEVTTKSSHGSAISSPGSLDDGSRSLEQLTLCVAQPAAVGGGPDVAEVARDGPDDAKGRMATGVVVRGRRGALGSG